jgi:hypothetical protein
MDLIQTLVEVSNKIDWTLFTGVCGGLLAITLGVKFFSPSRRKNYLKHASTVASKLAQRSMRTEDVQKEFGNLTIQTASLDHDKLFFSGGAKKPRMDDTTFDKNRPNSVMPRSVQLLEEALVFDSYGRKENACECLKKAIFKTENVKEQTRIQIIMNKYMESTEPNCLEALVAQYPSLEDKNH